MLFCCWDVIFTRKKKTKYIFLRTKELLYTSTKYYFLEFCIFYIKYSGLSFSLLINICDFRYVVTRNIFCKTSLYLRIHNLFRRIGLMMQVCLTKDLTLIFVGFIWVFKKKSLMIRYGLEHIKIDQKLSFNIVPNPFVP